LTSYYPCTKNKKTHREDAKGAKFFVKKRFVVGYATIVEYPNGATPFHYVALYEPIIK